MSLAMGSIEGVGLDAERLVSAVETRCKLPPNSTTGLRTVSLKTDGRTANIFRVLLDYRAELDWAPKSVIVKCAKGNGFPSLGGEEFNAYQREVCFYQTLGQDPSLPVPVTYLAQSDEQTDGSFIVMEDLSAGRRGSPFYDSVDDVAVGLQHLARMHAAYWDDVKLDTFPWLRRLTEMEGVASLREPLRRAMHDERDMFACLISDYSWQVANTWLDNWDVFSRHHFGHGATLTHGDAHLGQMFFPTQAQPRFVLFDWQEASIGWGGFDVARLLVTGLAPETRRHHESALVARYRRALTEGGVDHDDRDCLWFQIQIGNLWNLYLTVAAATFGPSQSLKGQFGSQVMDWRVAHFERVDKAMQDWDSGAALVRLLAEARHR